MINNQFELLNQLQKNPINFIRQRGLNIPNNLSDPNQIIQHLMNTGQVSQEEYNRAIQMANMMKH